MSGVLEDVLSPEKKVIIQGKEIKIMPFKFKDIGPVSKLMGGVFKSLEGKTSNMDMVASFSELLSSDFESIASLLSSSTGIKQKALEDMDLPTVFAIAEAVFKVNKPFFSQILGKFQDQK